MNFLIMTLSPSGRLFTPLPVCPERRGEIQSLNNDGILYKLAKKK